ncbi:MAG: membrane-bound serine protease (ClpP class) [Bacteroidia bacterium]|jgi:membrane-bound serine protease (ClpP class)
MKHFITLLVLFTTILSFGQSNGKKVVLVKLQEEIAPSASRLITKSLEFAEQQSADLILIEMDTYGGLLVDADSIRKNILDQKIPVYVFINKNAGSAGALISIACDKIYMAPGATIGSATVVSGDGEVLPDKYQSYMRGIMRATAESHGQDTVIVNGETVVRYKRDPRIAEAMVDDRIAIVGIIDSGRIVAFTTSEAIQNGYCEGEVNSVEALLDLENKSEYTIVPVTKSTLDKLVGFLAKPALQGALMMIIFWGIFFEIRSPGIGFPLAAAVLAAMLYFAPLYLDGLAENWEILLFIVGIILIGLEVFVIPGFGVAGITGILLTVGSLILSMIRNVNFDFTHSSELELSRALMVVLVALIGFVIGAVIFGKGMTNSPLFRRLIQTNTLENARTGHYISPTSGSLVGKEGAAHTDIRPIGKANIDGSVMDVKSLGEFISEGDKIQVITREMGYWVVEKV